ncbi:MAG: hypothetical protein ACLQMF_06175 [Rectinemataceae bacterium]
MTKEAALEILNHKIERMQNGENREVLENLRIMIESVPTFHNFFFFSKSALISAKSTLKYVEEVTGANTILEYLKDDETVFTVVHVANDDFSFVPYCKERSEEHRNVRYYKASIPGFQRNYLSLWKETLEDKYLLRQNCEG